MQYFTVYDLLLDYIKKEKISLEDMYLFFREKKIRKNRIDGLKQFTYIPYEEDIRDALCEFLHMSLLEIHIAMGTIPSEYRESFFANYKKIAEILSPAEQQPPREYEVFFENEFGTLYHGDCIEILRTLPDCSVDLIFADPPFNLGRSYDKGIDDSLTVSEYLNWTYAWLDECVRILKNGGRIFIYNIPKWCVYIASYLGTLLTFWDWIAIDMKSRLPIQNRLYPAHYGLVSFVKGARASTFHNQRIPLQVCRHCGGEIKDYGGYKNKMNPEGVNVSDVWTDIYPVRHSNSKNRKFNELSVKFLGRIISMATNEGDIVCDPFGGSGTTYAVAQLLKRKWIGCELGNCDIIKERLLNPTQDREQLEKAQRESGRLFSEDTIKLRRKNNFWTYFDLTGIKKEKKEDGQLRLDELLSEC